MTETERIKREIKQLSPPDRLRLAAGLLDGAAALPAHDPRKLSTTKMALIVADLVVVELRAALSLVRKP